MINNICLLIEHTNMSLQIGLSHYWSLGLQRERDRVRVREWRGWGGGVTCLPGGINYSEQVSQYISPLNKRSLCSNCPLFPCTMQYLVPCHQTLCENCRAVRGGENPALPCEMWASLRWWWWLGWLGWSGLLSCYRMRGRVTMANI